MNRRQEMRPKPDRATGQVLTSSQIIRDLGKLRNRGKGCGGEEAGYTQ